VIEHNSQSAGNLDENGIVWASDSQEPPIS
jgi:hypothetical protein